MDQVYSNLQPTKIRQKDIDFFFPIDNQRNIKSYESISQMVLFLPKEFSYGDIAGVFPFKPSRRNKYLYILYN